MKHETTAVPNEARPRGNVPHTQCVAAVFANAPAAERAIHELHDAGLPSDRMSLVATSVRREAPEVKEELQAGDDAIRDAAIGAGVGGVLGLLAGATVLAVSGLGLVFAAGPVGAGIAGSVVGAFLGGIGGWGVSDDHVERYQEMVHSGKVLVIVHGQPLEIVAAKQKLDDSCAEEVHLHTWTSADAPEVDDRPPADSA